MNTNNKTKTKNTSSKNNIYKQKISILKRKEYTNCQILRSDESMMVDESVLNRFKSIINELSIDFQIISFIFSYLSLNIKIYKNVDTCYR